MKSLSPAQAARKLGVSVWKVHKLIAENKLPCSFSRCGSRTYRLINEVDLDYYAESAAFERAIMRAARGFSHLAEKIDREAFRDAVERAAERLRMTVELVCRQYANYQRIEELDGEDW